MAKEGLKPMASLRFKTMNDFQNSNLNIETDSVNNSVQSDRKKHDQVALIQTTMQHTVSTFKHIRLKNNTTTVFCRAGARLLGPLRAQAGHLVHSEAHSIQRHNFTANSRY